MSSGRILYSGFSNFITTSHEGSSQRLKQSAQHPLNLKDRMLLVPSVPTYFITRVPTTGGPSKVHGPPQGGGSPAEAMGVVIDSNEISKIPTSRIFFIIFFLLLNLLKFRSIQFDFSITSFTFS
jgi:hypothetical protein